MHAGLTELILEVTSIIDIMDAVSLTIAVAPLGLYLLLIGALNLGRRPRLVSGNLDASLLAAALLGMVIVGPMNLFLPDAAVTRFGPYVWSLLVGFYALCVTLYILIARPKLLVFNASSDIVRGLLEKIATKLDASAKIAGDAFQLPNLSVQLHLDFTPGMRNVTLKATGDHQSFSGWNSLRRELKIALQEVEVSPNPRGFSFLAIGLLLLGGSLSQLVQMPSNLIAQRLSEMLRM